MSSIPPIYYQIIMNILPLRFCISYFLLALIGLAAMTINPIPVTGSDTYLDFSISQDAPALPASGLTAFINQVATTGDTSQLAGIYQYGTMRFPVVQQPKSAPGFVSSQDDAVTQFRLAGEYGTTALLAHNYLAGKTFSRVNPGSILTVVYGNGTTQDYRVDEIREYRALTPNSPYSKFVNLADTDGPVLTSTDLFFDIYKSNGRLVLQTCIEKDGQLSWGRLFILATPVYPYELVLYQ